jgi:hypothetical protein
LEFSLQGIQSTTVDAINTFAVREQVESMYAHIDGFSFISVSPIFEKKKYSRPEESYKQDSTNSGDSDDISTMIGAGSVFAWCSYCSSGVVLSPRWHSRYDYWWPC